eukprot:Blabericola_migrator_1__3513@NODE_2041_length_3378_cov_29_038357_g1296_i0_p1_GENE_NODE_2041_length_3378_cov_29_038357_g1296_i0NODE_2041_length_3378_cov_29_038357_g1296_i0_p1_ORF_typecomplete_len527_score121_14CAP/PF00188_26/5e20_NODE_2041_length_3378_cov_29_038357_g1296_i016553235
MLTRFVTLLGFIATTDAVKLSGSTQPLADGVAGSRAGKMSRIGIPAAWGTNPYAVQQSGQPVQEGLTSSQGTVYTDSTANGYRIRKALLDMHNYVRKQESPAAKSMTKLIWDFHLEAYSYQWAQKLCTNPTTKWFEHSPDNSNGLPAWPFRIATGENLYTSTAVRDSSEDFSDVVSKWYAEREWYDWGTGNAKPGAPQPVGHWKQLVRPEITTVGCTVVSGCKTQGDWRTFVVCHYDYGNVGKDPYEPNYQGQMCQSCPTGMTCCEAGLCSGKVPLEATSLGPFVPATETHDGWYECANHKRQDCAGTGASVFRETMPNDESDLEFQQCHCGKGPEPENFVDTVSHGYFWFRNKCYEAITGQGDDTSKGMSMYNMLQEGESPGLGSRVKHWFWPKHPYYDNSTSLLETAKTTTTEPKKKDDIKEEKKDKKHSSIIDQKEFQEKAQKAMAEPATPPPKEKDDKASKDVKLPPSSTLDTTQGNFTMQSPLTVKSPRGLEAVLSSEVSLHNPDNTTSTSTTTTDTPTSR